MIDLGSKRLRLTPLARFLMVPGMVTAERQYLRISRPVLG